MTAKYEYGPPFGIVNSSTTPETNSMLEVVAVTLDAPKAIKTRTAETSLVIRKDVPGVGKAVAALEVVAVTEVDATGKNLPISCSSR